MSFQLSMSLIASISSGSRSDATGRLSTKNLETIEVEQKV